jgi:surface carbohydrate biosynthesis protein
MSEERLLYLPVETKAREFFGKAFLAAKAAERGWRVVFGQAHAVRDHMQNGAPGAYIEIGIPDKKSRRLAELHAAGHRIANMCEEGLVYSDGRDYCNRKLGLSAAMWTDRLLLVGIRNENDIRTYLPELSGKLAVTGNPRFDALLAGPRCVYRKAAEDLRNQLGRFLLVNTNFTRANPYGGSARNREDGLENLIKRGMISGSAHEEFFRRFVDYQKKLMEGLQELLTKLAASNLVERIVIRPHPVENHDAWRQWAQPLNIEVRYEGSAIEWMYAAEAVLHPGCTTAIEGLMLDRPVYSYAPFAESEFLNPADEVSAKVTSADEFLAKLSDLRDQGDDAIKARLTPQRQKLAQFVANVDLPYAADRILDELDKLDLSQGKPRRASKGRGGLVSEVRRTLRRWWRGSNPDRAERRRQKFPSLSTEEADIALRDWAEVGVIRSVPRVEPVQERLLLFGPA